MKTEKTEDFESFEVGKKYNVIESPIVTITAPSGTSMSIFNSPSTVFRGNFVGLSAVDGYHEFKLSEPSSRFTFLQRAGWEKNLSTDAVDLLNAIRGYFFDLKCYSASNIEVLRDISDVENVPGKVLVRTFEPITSFRITLSYPGVSFDEFSFTSY